MSSITTLFPAYSFTSTELNEVANHIDNPVVKKWLASLASKLIEGLVHAEKRHGETSDAFLIRVELEKGKLATVEQLLAIEAVASPS